MSFHTIIDFLNPVNLSVISNDEGFRDTQLGKHIEIYEDAFPDINHADLIIVGCDEYRGSGNFSAQVGSADAVRKNFYSLYHWHKDVTVADIGNIKQGASLQDSYAAVKTVVNELIEAGKRVVIIGGSHDITLAQYNAYVQQQKIIEAVCVDAKIDLDMDSALPADKFLMEMLTGEPNFVKHYNHIGFQSYYVHPQMLETIDKLGFDCWRVGKVKEAIEEIEPAIRNASLFSFDISAIQHAHAPANYLTPNGFNGEEACTLMQYAGMSTNPCCVGIYNFLHEQDEKNLTATQIAHMLWYLMDGIHKGKRESSIEHRNDFNEVKLILADFETVFLQSKKTGRWWIQINDEKMIPCSKTDYLIASQNEIPERWLRAVERG
ncbi:MAG: formimidoylglutamase [Bacteroidetes bacterium]|nr:formimidoylglutamase [Bacteroidota bacterium]MBS1649436.1 formimidoylglutamase [Bacteroidota bacterium]